MKWIIVQSDGEHKGQDGLTRNDYLRECYALQYALKENHQQCDIWGKGHSNYNEIPDWSKYDVIWCMENSYMDWLPDFRLIKGPLKLQWIIDLHCQSREFYAKSSLGMDYVLHATAGLMESYSVTCARQSKHLWFPNGVDDRYFKKMIQYNTQAKRDVLFVGSERHERKEFLNNLTRDVGLVQLFATGIDMLQAISNCKIHVNKNIYNDINFRTFETIGLGTCLVTNYDPMLKELGFKHYGNCVQYKDYDHCVESIRGLIADDGLRQAIADEGYHLSKRNSYVVRVRDLLSRLGIK